MDPTAYALLFTLAPFAFGLAAVVAHRVGGTRALAATWLASAALFALLGYRDWRSPPDEGTPLSAYLLFATVPTAVGAVVAARTARGVPLVWRIMLAGTAGWVSIFPILLLYTGLDVLRR
jgi:hypothetical protein